MMFRQLTNTEELLILSLETDLKMENSPEAFREYSKELKQSHARVVIDLSRVRFVDSAGIGTLLKISEGVKKQGGELYLFGMNRALQSVFQLSGIHKFFNIIEGEEGEAIFPELRKR